MSPRNPKLRLDGFDDPYRDDVIDRLGPDGELSNLTSRVKMIISRHRTAGIYEVCDDGNRVLYVIRAGYARWLEVEL
jgi:hypothetical protein